MTQIESARKEKVTSEVELVAKAEGLDAKLVAAKVASGRIAIPRNIKRRTSSQPCGIGEGLKTKINANLGTSKGSSDIANELEKMRVAIELGSDTIMDLSTGAKANETRRAILEGSSVPVGTVPIYQMAISSLARHGAIKYMTIAEIFAVLEEQAKDGVDFFTIHAGVTKNVIDTLRSNPRILDIVSRGGAFLAERVLENGKENPFYEHFDKVLDIAKEYDITLSLGDGLRPGSVADATDKAQVAELVTLGELQRRAVENGVQVIIEGPCHIPINQIEANVKLEKSICNGAPFYVLGPLVTDVAPGYDHITAAIGCAIAGAAGADFLCYVTPSEHLALPTIEDVREGVIASKIAAHAADIAKGVKGAMNRDIQMAKARKALNWDEQIRLSVDPERARLLRESSPPSDKEVCTMCGSLCAIKVSNKKS